MSKIVVPETTVATRTIDAESSEKEMKTIKDSDIKRNPRATKLTVLQKAEWFGQTAASLFWIISVFVYRIEGPGDWLQLSAACSWFVANILSAISWNV